MKYLSEFTVFCALFVILAFLSSCASTEIVPDPDFKAEKKDMLTDAEINSIIIHSQNFLSGDVSKKLRLTAEQKTFVKTTRPEVNVRYTGPKYGRLVLTWNIDKGRGESIVLQLTAKGLLNVSKPKWTLEKIYRDAKSDADVGEFGIMTLP